MGHQPDKERGLPAARRANMHRLICLVALIFIGSGAAWAQEARPWELSVRAFSEFNDNVSLAPGRGAGKPERASLAYGALVSGIYRVYRDERWTAGAGATVFHKEQVEDEVDGFSVSSFQPGVFVVNQAEPFTVPTTTRLRYDFRRDLVGGDGFETRHSVGGSVQIRAIPTIAVGPTFGLAFKDFDDEGGKPRVTSRDAVRPSVGVSATYYVLGRVPGLTVSYIFARNIADGDNFDFESHTVRGAVPILLSVPAPTTSGRLPLFVTPQVSYSKVDYFNFETLPRRQQDSLNLGISFNLSLDRNLAVDLSFTHATSNSSRSEFDTRRNLVVLGLTYRF